MARKPTVADSEPFTEAEIAIALDLLGRFPEDYPGGGWTAWCELYEYFHHMSHTRQWALYEYATWVLSG